ncbi:MAG TPA: nucleotidyltransferase family protein, partial [Gemmiger formicilis]|nr:nucleotidyltransferase family protein [Gemmiger formicilis]
GTLDELVQAMRTKRYVTARLRRLVLDAALGYTGDLPALPPYLHVLGARKAALPRLKQASLPAATALADLARTGPEAAKISRLHNKAVDFSSLCREKIQPMGLAFTAKPVVI